MSLVFGSLGAGPFAVRGRLPGLSQAERYPFDISTAWRPSASAENVYERRDRATAADLAFDAHSQLRALAEGYACDDAEAMFVRDFGAAWDKVMNLDRDDLLVEARNGHERSGGRAAAASR